MRNYLGQFEEMVLLAVAILGDEAYGIAIKDELVGQTGKNASIGALHSALDRLERKGYLSSEMRGATAERGGRRKRYFSITYQGKTALRESRDLREQMWDALPPNFAFE